MWRHKFRLPQPHWSWSNVCAYERIGLNGVSIGNTHSNFASNNSNNWIVVDASDFAQRKYLHNFAANLNLSYDEITPPRIWAHFYTVTVMFVFNLRHEFYYLKIRMHKKNSFIFFLYIDKSVHIHLIVSLVISDNLSPNIVECYCEIFIEHTYILSVPSSRISSNHLKRPNVFWILEESIVHLEFSCL